MICCSCLPRIPRMALHNSLNSERVFGIYRKNCTMTLIYGHQTKQMLCLSFSSFTHCLQKILYSPTASSRPNLEKNKLSTVIQPTNPFSMCFQLKTLTLVWRAQYSYIRLGVYSFTKELCIRVMALVSCSYPHAFDIVACRCACFPAVFTCRYPMLTRQAALRAIKSFVQ